MSSAVAVTIPWDLVVSAAGGILAALLGVIVGGVISNRAQQQQWSLTSQTEACVVVLREYTRVTMAFSRVSLDRLNREYRDRLQELGTPFDWAPWNQALAAVNLIAAPDIVAAAHRIDALFWQASQRVWRGELDDPTDWFQVRDMLEEARLNFVNIARRQLGRPGPPLSRLHGRPGHRAPADS